MNTLFLEDFKTKSHTFFLGNKLLEIKGKDSQGFLQSQTTNNVAELKDSSFQFNTLLSLSGQIEAAFILIKINEQEFYIISNDELCELAYKRLEKFHISEDFEVNIISKNAYLKTHENGVLKGKYFFENDTIVLTDKNEIESNQRDLYETLYGVPDLKTLNISNELINNTLLDICGIDYKKGCFPGQETVSKINTRRGAAYKPVLVQVSSKEHFEKGAKVLVNSKKVGTVLNSFSNYLMLSLIRDFRVNEMNLSFNIGDKICEGTVYLYPYMNQNLKDLSVEFYDHAIDLFQSNRDVESIEYFLKAIELDPKFEDAYESLGVLYGRLGKFDKAIELMEKLKDLNSKCMMAYTNLSLYHMKIGNIETAEKYKADATVLNFQLLGDKAEQDKVQKELEQKKLSERVKRESMFKQVLEIDSEDAMANNGLGEILLEKNEFKEAKEHFLSAIKADEKYSVAYLGLGKSLISLNESTEAKEVFEKGIKIASKNGDLMPANEMQRLLNRL